MTTARGKTVDVSVHDIADYFIHKVDLEAEDVLTHLKLQKLVYYAQGWFLALFEKPLFPEQIHAWAHGPVCKALWQRFRERSWNSITPQDARKNGVSLPKDIRTFLDQVWEAYGQFSAKRLEEMTHNEKPWLDAWGDVPPGNRGDKVISNKAMKSFFKSIAGA